MTGLAFITGVLLAGAPTGADLMQAADQAASTPVPTVVTPTVDQQTTPPTQAAPVEAPSPSAPPAAPEQATPASQTPPPPVSPDDQDIVVTARETGTTPGDPYEAVNAKSFAVVQSVDKAFTGPVARTYKRALPAPIRSGVRHVLNNLDEPVIFLNFLLQHKVGKAVETFGRFTINSTLGVAGLFDVARSRDFNLPRRPNGFADTMGFYGVKPGAYFYLPLLGSTTVRDLLGYAVDRFTLPVAVGKPFNQLAYAIPTSTVHAIDYRAEHDDQIRALREESPNPYVTTRDLYLKSRQAEIDALHGKHDTTDDDGGELL